MKYYLLTGLLLGWLSLVSFAQHYPYNHFTTLEGLPSNAVRSSLIDSRDWFWVGTDAGVVRYNDGFFTALNKLDTLNGMRVWAMAEDDESNIWFGTYGNGLARFNGDSLIWYNSQNSELVSDDIRILKFLPNHKQLLIGGKDLFAVFKTSQIKNYPLPAIISSTRHFVDFMEVDTLIYALNNERDWFLVYTASTGKLERYERDFYPNLRIWSGLVTTANEVYYGFERNRYYYRSDDQEFVKEGIGQVFKWLEDPYGNVWAAAWKAEGPGGLFRFRNGEMIHFNNWLGIEEINGWGLEYDYTNNCLWFLSLDQGLIQLPLQIFSKLKLPFEKNSGIINEIQQDSTGNLWISASNSLWVYDGEKFENIPNYHFLKTLLKTHYDHFDEWYHILKNPNLADSALVKKFHSDLDETGDFNIFSLGFLLNLMNEDDLLQLKTGIPEFNKLKTNLFQMVNAPPDQFEPVEFYTVLPLKKHKVLIVNTLGTFSYDYPSGRLSYLNPFYEENVTLMQDTLYYTFSFSQYVKRLLIKDNKSIGIPWMTKEEYPDVPQNTVASKAAAGRLWFASRFQGLYAYHNKQFTHFNKSYPELSLNFTALEFDGDSLLYAGASNGMIYVFSNRQETPVLLNTLSAANGLKGRSIQWLVNDRQGYLWAGTNSAVNRIDLLSYHQSNTFKITHFSIPHGYEAFDVLSATIDNKARIWLDHENELLSINTALANQTAFEPYNIELRQIDLFLRPVEWETHSKTNLWTGLPAKAIFEHDQNYFTFHFGSNNRFDPDQDLYSYRLTGLDTNWSKPSMEKQAVFTNLDPGNYTLEVRLHESVTAVQDELAYPFAILKPWWQQWWFISLYVFAMLLAIYLGMNWRFRYLRVQQRRKYEVQQQLAELKLQALQAQMNPHFVFNVLTAIQNAILKNEIDNAIRYLSDVSHLIRRTLDYASEKTISLEDEVEYLENYLRLEKVRMNGKLQTQIVIDPALDLFNTRIPPMLIQPLVENAIKHGAGLARGMGEIKIHFERINSRQYQCIVEDNGPGIAAASATPYISRGLDMIHKRIQLLNEDFGDSAYSFSYSNKVKPETGARMVVEMRLKATDKIKN